MEKITVNYIQTKLDNYFSNTGWTRYIGSYVSDYTLPTSISNLKAFLTQLKTANNNENRELTNKEFFDFINLLIDAVNVEGHASDNTFKEMKNDIGTDKIAAFAQLKNKNLLIENSANLILNSENAVDLANTMIEIAEKNPADSARKTEIPTRAIIVEFLKKLNISTDAAMNLSNNLGDVDVFLQTIKNIQDAELAGLLEITKKTPEQLKREMTSDFIKATLEMNNPKVNNLAENPYCLFGNNTILGPNPEKALAKVQEHPASFRKT